MYKIDRKNAITHTKTKSIVVDPEPDPVGYA